MPTPELCHNQVGVRFPMSEEEPEPIKVGPIGIVIGIVATLLGVLLIEATYFPAITALEFMVPIGVLVVALWVGAYRTANKKEKAS